MADTTVDRPDEEAPAGVPITINGVEVSAEPGELLIAAAERHGVYIPHFCYHPRMQSVGMCRMCIVEVDTGRGPALQPTCMLECTPGMVVDTESAVTKKAQDGVLEFLLLNHPLDCPVCDKGGECPLQDQTIAYGPGESRMVEEKRHHEKPIAISDLVLLDRERCILCDRCTRFAKDVAGDTLIHFTDRGGSTEISTFPDHPFASYFSGNTVQICPVGALTSTTYRFRARPWDLEETESTCQGCSVGCRMAVQSSRNEVLRYLGVDIDPVNWGWLCDKGRFAFEAVNHADRLTEPLARSGEALAPVRWATALGQVAAAVNQAVESGGPAAIGVLGGARLTNESAYAWTKLAKGIIGTDNVDAQLGDGLPPAELLGLPRATIDDVCRPGGTVVLVAPDLKEELPVLYLRLRHAVLNDGVTLVEIAPHPTSVSELAAVSLYTRPGEQAEVAKVLVGAVGHGKEVGGVPAEALAQGRALVEAAGDTITAIVGRQTVGESGAATIDAAAVLLEALPATSFLSALRRGNVHGALDMGMAPGLLPGRVALDEGRDWWASHWATVPASTGRDAAAMLQAAAEGDLGVLVLVGADPLGDFPDRTLAEQALERATVIAVDQFLTESSSRAQVVLPAAGFAEVSGTTTNIEGRVSTVNQRVTAPGTARPDWVIAAELAHRLGGDLGLESVDDIALEVDRCAPAHLGLAAAMGEPSRSLDGVVVPLPGQVDDEVVVREDEPGDDATQDDDGTQDDKVEAGESVDAVEGDEAAEGEPVVAGPMPEVVRFAGHRVGDPPAVDSYSLRLAATRRLYDAAVSVTHSPSLAGLAPGTVLRVNPYDFDRLGVGEGVQVQATTARGSLSVELRVDPSVPRGIAAVVFNQPGVPVSQLIDATQRVTDVRIERGDA